VQEWGTRAANFQRILSRAYPNGRTPPELKSAVESLWTLASRAAQLEGELASQSRKLDSTERRGRALRAELGRKVEDLATDESRALREASSWRDRAKGVENDLRAHQDELDARKRDAASVEQSAKGDVEKLRGAFEAVGAARARIESSQRQIESHLSHALRTEGRATELRKQIDDLRSQLQRYSDALENDLTTGRDRIARKVKEALGFEKEFADASALLVKHLRGRPECRDMVEEILAADAESRGLHERRSHPRSSDRVSHADVGHQNSAG
jgi:serine/threonine-protein kinase